MYITLYVNNLRNIYVIYEYICSFVFTRVYFPVHLSLLPGASWPQIYLNIVLYATVTSLHKSIRATQRDFHKQERGIDPVTANSIDPVTAMR